MERLVRNKMTSIIVILSGILLLLYAKQGNVFWGILGMLIVLGNALMVDCNSVQIFRKAFLIIAIYTLIFWAIFWESFEWGENLWQSVWGMLFFLHLYSLGLIAYSLIISFLKYMHRKGVKNE